jgi:heme-degrading monooxygenase HmoA
MRAFVRLRGRIQKPASSRRCDMSVKVLIKRKVQEGKEEYLMGLINQLRSKVVSCPGYVSSETMRRADVPEYLVISSWDSLASWENWLKSPERMEIQKKIDQLLGTETVYEVYHYPTLTATLTGFKGWEGG